MAAAVHLCVDDFPEFILTGFRDHRLHCGAYPRVLWVSPLLGRLMGCRPGLWRPTIGFGGVWGWMKYLPIGAADGMDEFGQPD